MPDISKFVSEEAATMCSLIDKFALILSEVLSYLSKQYQCPKILVLQAHYYFRSATEHRHLTHG